MAIVGDAWINIHADTDRVRQQIREGFAGANRAAKEAGESAGEEFNKGFKKGRGRGGKGMIFSKQFERDLLRARTRLQNLIAVSNLLSPAIIGLLGGIASLGGGLFSLAAAAGQAGPAIAVLPGIFSAAAQAAITLKLAFSGVGQAISAGLRGGGGGGGGGRDIEQDARRIEDALDRVADARRRLQRVINDNAIRRQRAIEAAQDAQERVDDAMFAAAETERSYQQALLNTKEAQERVNEARREAVEDLQQLRFESEGAALSEQRARLEFDKSREALRRVQDLPPNSRARKEAELAFSEADLNLRRAIDKNNDLRKEEEEAQKAGVDGSQKVIDAQRDLQRTKEDEKDALRDVAQAQRDVVRARVEAARAARDVGVVERENADRQREAVENLKDALDDVKDARRQALDRGAGGGGGSDPFAEAMAKLSAEAQDFVRYIISIQGEFRKLRAAAGRNLFPQLEKAIQNLVDNLFPVLIPLLEGTGGVLGNVAVQISNTITRARNLDLLEKVWKTGDFLISAFGNSASNLLTSFLELTDAAGPLIRRFANWVNSVTQGWESTLRISNATGDLTRTLNTAGDVAAYLGRIFRSTFEGLSNMFTAATGPGSGGEYMLRWLDMLTTKFEEFTAKSLKDGSLGKYMKDASVNASIFLEFLGDIVAAFLRLGSGPEIGQFFEILRQLVPIIEQIFDQFDSSIPKLAQFAVNVGDILLAFANSGAVEIFFDVLLLISETMERILTLPFVEAILAFIAPMLATGAAVRIATKLLGFFAKAILGSVVALAKLAGFTLLQKFLSNSGTGFMGFTKKVNTATGAVNRLSFSLKAFAASNVWLLAITAAITAVTFFWQEQRKAQEEVNALNDSLDEQTGKFTDQSEGIIKSALKEDITTLEDWEAIYAATGETAQSITEKLMGTETQRAAIVEKIRRAEQESNELIAVGNDKNAYKYQVTKKALDGLLDSVERRSDRIQQLHEEQEIEAIGQRQVNEVTAKSAEIYKNLTDPLRDNSRHMSELREQAEQAARQQKILQEVTNELNNQLSELDKTFDREEARLTFLDFLDDLDLKLEDSAKGFDITTKKGKNARLALIDAAKDAIAEVQRIGGTPEEIAGNAETALVEVRKRFRKAKFSKEDINEVLSELDMLPSQVKGRLLESAEEAERKSKEDFIKSGEAGVEGLVEGLTSPESIARVRAAARKLARETQTTYKVGMGIASPSKVFQRFGKNIVEGLVKGTEDNTDKATNAIEKLGDAFAEKGGDKFRRFGEELKGILQEYVGDLEMVVGSVNDVKQGFEEALNPPETFDVTSFETPLKAAEAAAANATTALGKLEYKFGKRGVLKNKEEVMAGFMEVGANLKENLISALDEARGELEAIENQFANFKDRIYNSLKTGFDLSAAMQEAGEENGVSFTEALNNQASKVQAFADKVNSLMEAGFSYESISQVLSAGVGAGTEMADSLLDGGSKALAADQTIETTLTNLTNKLAETGKRRFFEKGLSDAQANVDGIEEIMTAQTKKGSSLMKAMNKLRKALARDVKIRVKLNKSRFDIDINVNRRISQTLSGITAGSPGRRSGSSAAGGSGSFGRGNAAGGVFRQPTYALIGEAGPEAVVPLNRTPGNSLDPSLSGLGGNTIINVYPSPGMDERDLAAKVSREISFNMRKGTI